MIRSCAHFFRKLRDYLSPTKKGLILSALLILFGSVVGLVQVANTYADSTIPNGMCIENGQRGIYDNTLGIYMCVTSNAASDAAVQAATASGYVASTIAGDAADEANDAISTSTMDDIEKACYDSGTKAFTWIFCPSISNLTYTANGLDVMTQELLAVNSSDYSSDDIQSVWGIMRNIANIILIILFLIIIFSQLTGVGIDNYGIKKMLPRIIVMAILINLSFVICELAVDVSNILGAGLRNLFGGVSNEIQNQATGGQTFVSGVIAFLFSAGAGASAVAGAVAEVAAFGVGGMVFIVILVVVLLLMVIVAAFILLAMLGVRRIIIIACVALAPIAFAFFILPNTQNIFKRWWTIFRTALIIFPICGAVAGLSLVIRKMVGGGESTGIISGAVGAFSYAIALIMPFAPYFLLPTLLRESISSLGKIGTAIQNFGNKAQRGYRGAWHAIRHSEPYRELSRQNFGQKAMRKAGKTGDEKYDAKRRAKLLREDQRNKRWIEKGGARGVVGGALMSMQRSNTITANKYLDERNAADQAMTHSRYLAELGTVAGQTEALGVKGFDEKTFSANNQKNAFFAKEFLAAADKKDTDAMANVVKAGLAEGMKPDDMAKLIRYAENKGAFNGLSDTRRQEIIGKLHNEHKDGFLAKDAELGDWMAKGGKGRLGEYGEWAANNMDATDYKNDVIERLGTNGLIAAGLAGTINPKDAEIALAKGGHDIEKRAILGAIRDGQLKPVQPILTPDGRIDEAKTRERFQKVKGDLKYLAGVTSEADIANYRATGKGTIGFIGTNGAPLSNAAAFAMAQSWVSRPRQEVVIAGTANGVTIPGGPAGTPTSAPAGGQTRIGAANIDSANINRLGIIGGGTNDQPVKTGEHAGYLDNSRERGAKEPSDGTIRPGSTAPLPGGGPRTESGVKAAAYDQAQGGNLGELQRAQGVYVRELLGENPSIDRIKGALSDKNLNISDEMRDDLATRIDVVSATEIPNYSRRTVASLIAAGKITPEEANKALASGSGYDNPTKIMLGTVADGFVTPGNVNGGATKLYNTSVEWANAVANPTASNIDPELIARGTSWINAGPQTGSVTRVSASADAPRIYAGGAPVAPPVASINGSSAWTPAQRTAIQNLATSQITPSVSQRISLAQAAPPLKLDDFGSLQFGSENLAALAANNKISAVTAGSELVSARTHDDVSTAILSSIADGAFTPASVQNGDYQQYYQEIKEIADHHDDPSTLDFTKFKTLKFSDDRTDNERRIRTWFARRPGSGRRPLGGTPASNPQRPHTGTPPQPNTGT